jgi:RNA polymerase sigma-70 factor (ECF subfamily)
MDDALRADFDGLFCDLLPRLYRRAALLAGQALAEDMVHEAYLKLAARPRRLLEHPEPYGYAFATVVSVVRDGWRRGRRQVLVADIEEDLRGAADGGLGWREGVWEARRLLAGLAPGEAAAVLLVDLDGYTIDQAAELLRVHRGTVSRARARAMDKLRRLRQSSSQEESRERTRRRTRGPGDGGGAAGSAACRGGVHPGS